MLSSNTPSSGCKAVHGSRIVIDDILLYSTNVFTLLRYFSCVARVFVRYRLSFKLSKCKFFSPRVEYLGYDLTSGGNCPAQSKFDLLTNWGVTQSWNTSCILYWTLCVLFVFFSLVRDKSQTFAPPSANISSKGNSK